MNAERDGNAPPPMTFDQFMDSPFAQRVSICDVGIILREVERCGGVRAFHDLHLNRPAAALPALRHCPRPFCRAPAELEPGGEVADCVRCTACGWSMYGRRHETRLALVERWNAPRPTPASSLAAFLRKKARAADFADRHRLSDAAELIERQAAQLPIGWVASDDS